MSNSAPPGWVYNETVKMFAIPGTPVFEDPDEQIATWGRAWGINNDVGRIRSILMHRPGREMDIVDPTKRIDSIGSFGDLKEGWYFQSDTVPPISEMQAEHDNFVKTLEAKGVEVHHVDGVAGNRMKSCYTRDPLIMVQGGAIVCRMGTRIRRGEELAITRTLARLGIPILRTISGNATMEGGSFTWLNSTTCAIGCGIRVSREGAEQVRDVLKTQGVELLIVDLAGYDIHIDVNFMMIDKDLALLNPFGLPYSFLLKLKELGIRWIETSPADDPWIINSLAIAPGELLMPEGATNKTLDALAAHGVTWTTIPYSKMQLNGGGLHCSTTPLIRDAV